MTDGLVDRAPISCGGDSPRAGRASACPVRGLSPRRLSLVYLVAKLWEQGRRRTAEVTATHPTGHELQIRAWLRSAHCPHSVRQGCQHTSICIPIAPFPQSLKPTGCLQIKDHELRRGKWTDADREGFPGLRIRYGGLPAARTPSAARHLPEPHMHPLPSLCAHPSTRLSPCTSHGARK